MKRTNESTSSREVYICHTVYHVLISAVKALRSESSPDLIVTDAVPDVDGLADRFRRAGVFGSVEVVGKGRPFPVTAYARMPLYQMFPNEGEDRLVDFISGHGSIFIFNDITQMGYLLMANGIEYHLIEDGLDVFKIFDLREQARARSWRRKLMQVIFGLPKVMGTSKYCLDIELNSSSQLKTKMDKPLIEVPRTELFSGLSEEQIKILFDIFQVPEVENLQGGVLVLTTPFLESGYSEAQIFDYYRRVFEAFGSESDYYVKPHPRDLVDYSKIIDSHRIISKNAPIELFVFAPGLQMRAAIAYMSTALPALTFVEAKYFTKPGLEAEGVINLDIDIDRNSSKQKQRRRL